MNTKLSVTIDHDPHVEHCPECGEPAHPSETNDDGVCLDCLGDEAILPGMDEQGAGSSAAPETFTFTGHELRSTAKAILFGLTLACPDPIGGGGPEIEVERWIPKSQIVGRAGDAVTIPLWLAKREGLFRDGKPGSRHSIIVTAI